MHKPQCSSYLMGMGPSSPLTGVFCGVLLSADWLGVVDIVPSFSPFTFLFTGLSDGAFGREGRVGLT